MSASTVVVWFLVFAVLLLVYWAGRFFGAEAQRDLWRRHMQRGNDYVAAVKDLQFWCGHTSPHALLIARHLKALGEGLGHNAGTPNLDEPCSVDGLREQLRRLDESIAAAKPAEPTLPTQGDAK